jgi:hypothetical protein
MSREVVDYFNGYNLSQVADTLLEMYDFTNLPAVQSVRYAEKPVTITNETFIDLYTTLGPRNKKVSLARLFEFAYNMDVLAMPRFEEMRGTTSIVSPVYTLLDRAYRLLLQAQKNDDSAELKVITDAVYNYKEVIKNA